MSTNQPAPQRKSANPPALVWTGRVISALPALVLLASGVFKFMPLNAQAKEGLDHVGWNLAAVPVLGVTELIVTILYLIPQTSVLGAILITGYMGGAIATHARVGDLFIFQAAIGVLAWLGLFLRDARLRSLLPLRTLS